MDKIMSKTQFLPKVEIEPYNSKLTKLVLSSPDMGTIGPKVLVFNK